MDEIFLADGQIWTSAGMTACIDLALAMVENDLGHDLARAVARILGALRIAELADSRNIRLCSTSPPDPTACKKPSHLPDSIWMSRCPTNDWPRWPASVHGSLPACFAPRRGTPPPR